MVHAPAAGDVEQLIRMREDMLEAERTGNTAFFDAALDDDAVIMPPDVPAREGKASCLAFVREVLQSLLAQFERTLVCDSAEVVVNGTLAFDRGHFSQTLRDRVTGDLVYERGQYLWLYMRRNDGWKLARVIWNGGEELDDVEMEMDDDIDWGTGE